jgi:D-glycero-alpha-D-manno-heptose 1-phosphate guanylyltransferase
MIEIVLTREALILAGGLGTRLQDVVNDVPKSMAPLQGRPFLEYLMDYWLTQGITRFVLSVGYLGHIITSHFGDCYKMARIEYVMEDSPLSTGGAVRYAL